MDRDTILKHSRSIRLNSQLLSDFTELLAQFCEKKAYPEHLQGLIQIIQTPMIRNMAITNILEEFEKEYHIIQLINKEGKVIDIT